MVVELAFEFPMGTSGRGWANFIPKKALQDPTLGYVKDGWLTLIAHVSLLGTSIDTAALDGRESILFCSKCSLRGDADGKCRASR